MMYWTCIILAVLIDLLILVDGIIPALFLRKPNQLKYAFLIMLIANVILMLFGLFLDWAENILLNS